MKEHRSIGQAKGSSSTQTSRLCEHLPFIVGPVRVVIEMGGECSLFNTSGRARDADQAVSHSPLFLLLTLPAASHPVNVSFELMSLTKNMLTSSFFSLVLVSNDILGQGGRQSPSPDLPRKSPKFPDSPFPSIQYCPQFIKST